MSSVGDDLREVGPWGQSVALAFRFLLIGLSVIVAIWLVSNVRRIPPDTQAVVIRFGQVARVQGPGLLLAWPQPVERVTLLPASSRQNQLSVRRFDESVLGSAVQGYELSPDARLNGAFLLTGDGGIVHLEARLFYQISDPVAYMLAAEHVEPALERAFVASAVNIMAARNLDSILVASPEVASREREAGQRGRLRSDLLETVNRRLESLAQQGCGLGITVSRVDLVPSIPAGAKSAFDSVLIVTQGAQTDIALARTRAQQTSQQANRERDRIATRAVAAATELTTTAAAQTASIIALAKESQDTSRSMQTTRIYYDRLARVLRKAGRIDAVDPSAATRTIAPGAGR
jgi:regulator of protease activity HflC (stomatin/prohibitin superfamily)